VSRNQIFKFLNSEHVDQVLKGGTIRVSTFSHYRSLEKPGIGDRTEASTNVNVDQAVLKGTAEPWRPKGFLGATASSSESTLILKNVQAQYNHPDRFIFCVSEGDRATLIEAMCFTATEPYDACLRLLISLQLLAHRILCRGEVEGANCTTRASRVFFMPSTSVVLLTTRSNTTMPMVKRLSLRRSKNVQSLFRSQKLG
jgi:hypothetical protein